MHDVYRYLSFTLFMFEILFQYGSFTLTTLNVLIVIGFLMSAIFLIRYVQFKKMSLRFIVNHMHWFILAALIGGRLAFIAENTINFNGNFLSILYVWDLGFSAFGMLYATLALLIYLSHRDHEDFWAWIDTLALAGLISLFFIHIGYFFNGTEYGKPTDLPWGFAFDTFNIPFTVPIHPVQLYSALITFIIFNFSMWSAKKTHLTGMVGTMAIMLYSLSAIGIDFFHNEPSTYVKISHTIIASIAFIFHILNSHKKTITLES